MSDSRDSLRRLKQLSGRVSLFEFFMAIFLLALYIMKPEILSPLTEHLSDSSFLPVMTALLPCCLARRMAQIVGMMDESP